MKKIIIICLIILLGKLGYTQQSINDKIDASKKELLEYKGLSEISKKAMLIKAATLIKDGFSLNPTAALDFHIFETTLLNNPCTNIDFEFTDTTNFPLFGWRGFGSNTYSKWSVGYVPNTFLSGLVSPNFIPGYHHQITNTLPAAPGSAATTFGGAYHAIQSTGADPLVPILPRSISGNSLRLGNDLAQNGVEGISKTFIVPASMNKFRFQYALVCKPDDSNAGFFNAKAIDAAGNIVAEYTDMGQSSNPFFIPYPGPPPPGGMANLYYRPWHIAELDVSSLIGQQVTIVIMNTDCFGHGHFQYVYLDDFCTNSNDIQEGFITLNSTDSCQKFPVTLNGTFGLPNITSNPATAVGITLKFYQSGILVGIKPVSSPVAPSYSTSIVATDFLPNYNGGCFDVVAELSFKIKDMGGVLQTVIKTTGTPLNGFRPGTNNDICINCCNCQQTLNSYLFWTTGTGNAINDQQLDLKCGDTLINKLDCFQPYTIKVNNPCGPNCSPDEMITTITYPAGGGTVSSASLSGVTLIANQVGSYTVSIKVKCNGKWCDECKLTFIQTKKCEPPCDNCKDKVQAVINASASTAVVGTHTAPTTLNASFLLGGGTDTYTQIRANIVDFNITSDNANCLQSYTTPRNWGSIINGTLGGFTPMVTNYPGVSTASGSNNPREIIFSTPTPTAIPMATPLNLTIIIPGVNPLSCCCIKVVLFVKITYRNNKCEECSKIVRIALTECPTGTTTNGGTGGGITFDTNLTGQPQYRIMHSPNNADRQILNQSQDSESNKN